MGYHRSDRSNNHLLSNIGLSDIGNLRELVQAPLKQNQKRRRDLWESSDDEKPLGIELATPAYTPCLYHVLEYMKHLHNCLHMNYFYVVLQLCLSTR